MKIFFGAKDFLGHFTYKGINLKLKNPDYKIVISTEFTLFITVDGFLLKVSFLVIYWLIQAGQHRNFNSILGVWSTPHTFLCSHAQSPSWKVELKNSQGEITESVDVFSPCKTDSSVYCYGRNGNICIVIQ